MASSHELSSVLALIACACLAACGGEPTGNGINDTPASLTLSETSLSFASLQESEQLTATVRNSDGQTVSASVTWTSDDEDVATVDGNGLVTSQDNGTANIAASAGGGVMATADVSVQQAAAGVARIDGDMQTGPVLGQLATDLVVEVQDGNAQPVEGEPVDWEVLVGGGAVSPASGVSQADGRLAAQWTLGTVAGDNRVAAKLSADPSAQVTFTAIAEPGPPEMVLKVLGDETTWVVGQAEGETVVVQVIDAHQNGVSDHPITFTPGGNGTVDPASTVTDGSGGATTSWSMGDVEGPVTLDVDAGAVTGSPLAFTGTVVESAISNLGPGDGMIEGTPGGGTINEAKGFHMVPDSNTVAVDGVETAISGFSLNDPDSITADGKFVTWGALFFDVPSFGLADTVTVEVTLTVRGVTTSAMHLLCPAAGCPP